MEKPVEVDDLSGLLIRRVFLERLDEAVLDARKGKRPLSVALTDIDFFKNLNDTYGHAAGDAVIRRFAQIAVKNVRATDLVGRYGGEEFVFLFPDTPPEEALFMVEDIRRLIAEKDIEIPLAAGGAKSLRISFSGGLASYPRDGRDGEGLIRQADGALYRAKESGRNRVCLSVGEKMTLKSTYYTASQLERLQKLARATEKTEAFLLREALHALFLRHKELLED